MAEHTEPSAEQEANESQSRRWPHNFSFCAACLTCTLSFLAISRFAVLAVHYGPVFVVQFALLSLVAGLPLLTFYACLGQYLGSGLMESWRISPVFLGIGLALLVSQVIFALYNGICVSYLFVYLRDALAAANNGYRWSRCFADLNFNRGCEHQLYNGTSSRLGESVSDYLAGVVLVRGNPAMPRNLNGQLRPQNFFNVIVLWMAVFIGLSKGLKSYGKVVAFFAILPLLGFLFFSLEVIGSTPVDVISEWVKNFDVNQLTTHYQAWLSAARECFLVWLLLSPCVLQLSSHNSFRHNLLRDLIIVFIVTLSTLCISALLGVSLVHILNLSGFDYVSSSFETLRSYDFLRRNRGPIHNVVLNKNRRAVSLVAGLRLDTDEPEHSGYQVMRLAVELVPAYASIMGPRLVSPVRVALFYVCSLFLGVSQQLVLCHTAVSSLMSIGGNAMLDFQSPLTFVVCLIGLGLTYPLASDTGIFFVYVLDSVVGNMWWLVLLHLLLIFAICLLRGKPYSAEHLAKLLPRCIRSTLVFLWLVVLPILLTIFGLMVFESGGSAQHLLMSNRRALNSLRLEETAALFQLLPLALVPIVALVQLLRHLLCARGALEERLHNLFKPTYSSESLETNVQRENRQRGAVLTQYTNSNNNGNNERVREEGQRRGRRGRRRLLQPDPPPKYSPPPSYSTATGARIARMLRQSYRQSMRRLREIAVPTPPTAAVEMNFDAIANSNPPLALSPNVRPVVKPEDELPPDYSAATELRAEVQRQNEVQRQPEARPQLEVVHLAEVGRLAQTGGQAEVGQVSDGAAEVGVHMDGIEVVVDAEAAHVGEPEVEGVADEQLTEMASALSSMEAPKESEPDSMSTMSLGETIIFENDLPLLEPESIRPYQIILDDMDTSASVI